MEGIDKGRGTPVHTRWCRRRTDRGDVCSFHFSVRWGGGQVCEVLVVANVFHLRFYGHHCAHNVSSEILHGTKQRVQSQVHISKQAQQSVCLLNCYNFMNALYVVFKWMVSPFANYYCVMLHYMWIHRHLYHFTALHYSWGKCEWDKFKIPAACLRV